MLHLGRRRRRCITERLLSQLTKPTEASKSAADMSSSTNDDGGGGGGPGGGGEEASAFLKLARRCNNAYETVLRDPQFTPFLCGGRQVGLLSRDVARELLTHHPDSFQECSGRRSAADFPGSAHKTCVRLADTLRGHGERSRAVAAALAEMRAKGGFGRALDSWRGECYEVRPRGRFGREEETLFQMERAATSLFGLHQYGVDINGYVLHPQKGKCVWMQRRAKNKPTWPGAMDNFVGGGLTSGYGVLETGVKEAEEEANVGRELAAKMRPVGTVTFFFQSPRGLFPNTEFVYDLELPADFVPRNNDGEVDGFELLTMQQLAELVVSPDMKTTSTPITLDFLVRHGHINSENEPNLPELVENLHMPIHKMYQFEEA